MSALRSTLGGINLSSAVRSPAKVRLGGMQSFSLSIHHSPNMNMRMGRKRLSTNVATSVIRGMANEQIWPPPPAGPPIDPCLGSEPSVVDSNSKEDPGGDAILTPPTPPTPTPLAVGEVGRAAAC